MRTLHTFVVRILRPDDFGSGLHGQICEPASPDEWRASFLDLNDLLAQLLQRTSAAPGEPEMEPARKRSESNS